MRQGGPPAKAAQPPEKVRVARLKLLQSHSYLATALMALHTYEVPGIRTMAVDPYWRLYFDPRFIEEHDIDEIAGTLYHEVWHLLRNHAHRLKDYPQIIANLAGDAAINDNALKEIRQQVAPFKLPEGAVTPQVLNLPEEGLEEEYAARLTQKATIRIWRGGELIAEVRNGIVRRHDTPGASGVGSGGESKHSNSDGNSNNSSDGDNDGNRHEDESGNVSGPNVVIDIHLTHECGSGAHGHPMPWDLGEPTQDNPGLTRPQAESVRRVTAKQILQASKTRGTVPGWMKRWAEATLNPKVPWQKVLRSAVRKALTEVLGMDDYTWRRPNRHQHMLGRVILPELTAHTPNVAIAVDTSGSMSDEYLAQALAEIGAVLKASGHQHHVTVLAADAAVAAVKKVRSLRDVELAGGGGTDMGEPLRYMAEELKPTPALAIVLTDGYTPWPDQKPKGIDRVVIGLLVDSGPDGDADDGGLPQTPPWAKTVVIPVGEG